MGKLEKVVVLSVLFVIAVILVVSLTPPPCQTRPPPSDPAFVFAVATLYVHGTVRRNRGR